MVTGLDLVDWQLQVAAGNPLPLSQGDIPLVGHAFEARIYAETPRNNFMPDSGTLLHVSTPEATTIFAPAVAARTPAAVSLSGTGAAGGADPTHITPTPGGEPSLRLEEGFSAGAQIGVFYDPMIAKLIAYGRDRTDALRVLRKGLEEYEIVGLNTNIEFLRALAGHPAFVEGDLETGFIQVCGHHVIQIYSELTLHVETLRRAVPSHTGPSTGSSGPGGALRRSFGACCRACWHISLDYLGRQAFRRGCARAHGQLPSRGSRRER
jgi:acetyl/propionyl-CoA carboxylase alpha subunit